MHETIESAIYAITRGELRTALMKMLRQILAGRRTYALGTARFTDAQEMTPMAPRPPEVCARVVPGHWEGDLIKGASNASAVGALVERTSRYVMLLKLEGTGALSVLVGFARRLRIVSASLRNRMTYDQGTEMAPHQTLASRLHMNIYFCEPHSP